MSKPHVIVVGAGLFGSIAATLLRNYGYPVTVVDAQHEWSASKAAGCVIAPSWLSSLTAEDRHQAMVVLQHLYKVHDIDFKTNLIKSFHAQRIDPADILVTPEIRGEASVADGIVQVRGETLRGLVLVAAGIASARLVSMPKTNALWGASVRFKRQQIPTPRLHVYAPYKQALAFNIDSRDVWVGDGTALIERTWAAERNARILATLTRAKELFGLEGTHSVHFGARPYVEGHKGGYFARTGTKTWVSTGGAKNGTALAALQAWKFLQEIQS